MRLLLTISLFVSSVHSHWVDEQLSDVIQSENDDIWSTLQKIRDFSIPNFKGCEQTKACYMDLLTSTGFSSDPFPNYADYLAKMTDSYGSGQALSNYCGTFYAVSNCYSLESDSCRSPTVFATLFNLTKDDAYRFSSDLDLRKIMCDNQQALADPCMNKMTRVKRSIPHENDAAASCDTVAADFSTFMSKTDASDCPDAVKSVNCQMTTKTKEIETLGACDGKIPPCQTNFHSCDNMKTCFNTFYAAVEKAGVKSPLPDYTSYASSMKRNFENEDGIEEMCRYQSSLHACILRHANKNCPINTASFRTMFNMNYEQAYDYSTDFNLRKKQCINQEGVMQNSCLHNATLLLNICKPSIPHNLTLGRSCTDLRLAMNCDNFAVRQYCPDEARKMYCVTQEIIYQQGALGFCDGWMPDCNSIVLGNGTDTTDGPQPEPTTDGGLLPTLKKIANLSLPNLGGCEQTKACFINLLTSTGFSSDPFPNYDEYKTTMDQKYGKGEALSNYCGTFDAVSHCFSQESDSCRTPTVFATLFNLKSDDAYRFASDLDLRKIMCDNQQALADPCMNKMAEVKDIHAENDATVSCDTVSADFSAVIAKSADTGCSEEVQSVFCQINAKNKEIETIGACDGKIPKCWTKFHSCDNINTCFHTFYDAVEKAGVKTPLPDYTTYASNMKRKFENANGIDEMCRYQSSLHACIIRHANKNCPINAASFRTMFNMNYEQAYAYSTDFNLRKAQCLNAEGMRQNSCLTKAKPLLNICQPYIPHDLTLGRACTDLRLAMKCDNFAVRQSCSEEAWMAYCVTQGIIYEQGALGFCDGWMPDCVYGNFSTTTSTIKTTEPTTITSTTKRTPPTTHESTSMPTAPTVIPDDPTAPTKDISTSSTPSPTKDISTPSTPSPTKDISTPSTPSPTSPTTSLSSVHFSIMSILLLALRLVL